MITMAAITANVGLDLGIPEQVREAAARLSRRSCSRAPTRTASTTT